MKLKKFLSLTLGAVVISGSFTSHAFANTTSIDLDKIESIDGKNVEIIEIDENMLEVSNATEESLFELDKLHKEEYDKETGAGQDIMSSSEITPFSATICNKCSSSYRYGTKNGSDGYAKNTTTAGGYHYNNGKVHWSGVHGGVQGRWDNSGNAQFIRNSSSVSISGSSLSVSWPGGWTGSTSKRSFKGTQKKNVKSHINSFSGISASSSLFLGALTHTGDSEVRGNTGHDFRPISSVTIN